MQAVESAYESYFSNAAKGNYFTADGGSGAVPRFEVAGTALGVVVYQLVKSSLQVVFIASRAAGVALLAFQSVVTLGSRENTKRLYDQCGLFALEVAVLLQTPLQLTVQGVAVVAGLISPRKGYQFLSFSLRGVVWIKENQERIEEGYKVTCFSQKLSKIYNSIVKKACSKLPSAFKPFLATVLTERLTLILNAGLLFPLANLKKFDLHNLNPTQLTKKESNERPILLLHGRGHDQSAWLPIVYSLRKRGFDRPIYTLNLPSGQKDFEDVNQVVKKILEIKRGYSEACGGVELENFKIDLVGHSKGARLSLILSQLWAESVKKSKEGLLYDFHNVVTIACPQKEGFFLKIRKAGACVFEIIGRRDPLVRNRAFPQRDPSTFRELEEGHLGLLFSSETSQVLREVLSDS